jgi:CHAT domain-containing protein/Tfp pilus assembly protein PilF
MPLQKISILFWVLLFPLFKPYNTETNQSQISEKPLKYTFNIDLLNVEIKNSGWNEERLIKYHFYIINSENILNKDLKNLPYGFEISFLNSLLLKKQQKYEAMYDTLYKSLSDKIKYLPYYEEFVFSASIVNKINLIEKEAKKVDFATKNFVLGLISSSKGKNENALKFFKEALKKGSTDKNIFYQLSYAYRNTGDYDNAGKTLKKAAKLFSNDEWFITKVHLAEGSLFFLSGDYDNALKIYQEGLKLSLENSDKQNEAKSYINLGIIEDISGNVTKAHEYFNKAINITSLIKDYENLATAYSELGVSYTFTNEPIEAKNNYLKCLELFENMHNRSRLSLLYNNLGKIYMSLFDNESALDDYEKGLEYAGDNKRSQALNLTGIADVYANLSNFTKAIQYYRKAQEISSEIKEISMGAEINSGLGTLNYNLNRYNTAIQYYSSAKEFANESGNPYLLADMNHKIALSYFELDSLNISEKYFNEALKLSRKNSIPYNQSLISIDLAALQKEKRDFIKSLENIHLAESIAKENGFDYISARAKVVEGEIENELGNFKKAENLFEDALKISRQLNEFNLQVEASYSLAKLFEKNGFIEAAESYYNSAVGLIEDVSRPLFEESEVQISYFSGQKEIYDSFALFYLKQNKFKEAFELIDKSRSRNMVQNLSNLKLQVLLNDKSKLDKIYEYEWVIHSGIYSDDKVDKVKAEYTLFKNKLIYDNPQLERYLNKKNHFFVFDIQNNLNNDEHFLSFYSTEEKTFIFLITKDDFKHFEINAGRDEIVKLKNKISPYFNTNNKNQNAFYNQDLFSFNARAAYEFYNVVLKRVFSGIPEGDKIIVSQAGELVSLPLDFLIASFDENQSSYNYSDKDYLIYHYSFSYAPSASVFVHQKKNNLKTSDKILIAGNPKINSSNNQFAERRGLLEETGGLPRNVAMLPLKYSGEEITQVSNLINADQVLTDNKATETGFKENAELSKIIHLSTHSFLFNKQPVIFFSNYNDQKNDGFLEAGEIVQLQLNSDLVVLSSCNSGLGNVDASEGIIGMTKAFFEAGTKSVVVSLWEVNDKYTSKLMTLLYKKLSEGYDKDEAMRLAKIDFIKNYSSNPYFWSAFILSGNTDKIEIKTKLDIYPYVAGLSLIIIFAVIIFSKRRSRTALTQ